MIVGCLLVTFGYWLWVWCLVLTCYSCCFAFASCLLVVASFVWFMVLGIGCLHSALCCFVYCMLLFLVLGFVAFDRFTTWVVVVAYCLLLVFGLFVVVSLCLLIFGCLLVCLTDVDLDYFTVWVIVWCCISCFYLCVLLFLLFTLWLIVLSLCCLLVFYVL